VGEIMSKTPGRKTQSSPYRKRGLSSDAKIISALLKQPLSKKEICMETKISDSTFHRNISLLIKSQKIKQVEDGKYALWEFEYLEKIIKDAFIKSMNQTWAFSSGRIVNMVGKNWPQIQVQAYKIAHELDLTISEQNDKTIFYKGSKFNAKIDNNCKNSMLPEKKQ
jgi:hypothetical protein